MTPIYASMFLTLLAAVISLVTKFSPKKRKLCCHKISFGICMLSLLLLIIGFFS